MSHPPVKADTLFLIYAQAIMMRFGGIDQICEKNGLYLVYFRF